MYLLKVVRLGGEQTTQKQIFTLTQFSPVLKQVVVGRLDDVFLEMWWFIGGDVVVHLGGGDMIISLVEMWWFISRDVWWFIGGDEVVHWGRWGVWFFPEDERGLMEEMWGFWWTGSLGDIVISLVDRYVRAHWWRRGSLLVLMCGSSLGLIFGSLVEMR